MILFIYPVWNEAIFRDAVVRAEPLPRGHIGKTVSPDGRVRM